MNNKIGDFIRLLEDNFIDIAFISETWLTQSNNTTTAALKAHGYSLLHTHRVERRGGGTAIIFSANLQLSVKALSGTFKTFEITAGILKSVTGAKILLLALYRTGPLSTLFIQELDALLAEASSLYENIIIGGDLNIHFEHDTANFVEQSMDTFESYTLSPTVMQSTHVNGGWLDELFMHFADSKINKSDVVVDEMNCLGSDHYPVYFNINLEAPKKYYKSVQFRDMKKIDDEEFRADLNRVIGNFKIQGRTFGNSINCLQSELDKLVNCHAPIIDKTVPIVDTAPWVDKEYKALRVIRRAAEKTWKKTKREEDRQKYREVCKDCSALLGVKKRRYVSNIIDNSSNNVRTLFQVVNKGLDRNQTKVLPDYTDDLKKLASDCNEFFVKKVENFRSNMVDVEGPQHNYFPSSDFLSEFEPTTLDELKEIIGETGVKCSPADLLPQALFKENIDELLPVLVELVNLSLQSGNVDGVKLADIIPAIKGEGMDPNILKNYRPVSNLTFLGKIIERVVLRRLTRHMSENNLHCEEQSAYKKNNSTETLLIKVSNDLLIASDERTATVVMLLDLSAAFDTVDHDLMLKILENEIGLKGTVLDWFRSFLKGRSQRIRIGSDLSEEIEIRFGVPQGSVLGPVLFNIYIRSIYCFIRKMHFKVVGYADDHQIYKSFSTHHQHTVLSELIKQCFAAIKKWMNQYYLKLNDDKTQIIIFGSSRILQKIKMTGVNIAEGIPIQFKTTVKNLGILMDNKLTMRKQVIEVKKRSFRTLRNIRRIRFLLTEEQLKVVINSLVVSCLDYCNGLYYGISEKLLNQLQLIQNCAAKVVKGKYKHDHLDQDLQDLHWLTVKKRVLFKIALLVYKALNGLAPGYLQDMIRYNHHGHSMKLVVPNTNTKDGLRSFSSAGPRLYNNLPKSVKESDCISSFKKRLKTFLFEIPEGKLNSLIV